MPKGFEQLDEAELHKAYDLLPTSDCEAIKAWWFAIYRGGRQTGPSFDIASTCKVRGRRGFLLVEAKAHDQELIVEERGKPLRKEPSAGEKTNHNRIGQAIQAANPTLAAATGMPFSLSRDNRYQMSNRIASACKLTELGYSVILVYLGFLGANEMADKGRPIKDHGDWSNLMESHSAELFPAKAWNQAWTLNGQLFIPLIRSRQWPLEPGSEA